ncbi:MAG: hypothetical protein DI535_03575 [Citrobacter freundii]|nr:MAG: hypothetical protein DI535_03575 [Citrobacter freundii]
MISDKREDLIREKIDLLFGDEGLSFQTTKIISFFESAYENKFDGVLSTITQLSFTHNDLVDLIDIGHLINQAYKKNEITIEKSKIIKKLKHLKKTIGTWDDFPSHLSPIELNNPLLAIEKFFFLQNIYDWKILVRRVFDAAIGNLSMGEATSEFNIALDALELFRLLDSVWIFKHSVDYEIEELPEVRY